MPTNACPVLALAFLSTLATAAETPHLRVDSGGHMAIVRMLAISANGRELYSASDDKTVQVWDAETGERVRVLRGWIGAGDDGAVLAADASRDGRLLAVAGATGRHDVRLLDPVSGAVLAVLRGHAQTVRNVKFSPDGRWLASSSLDHSVRVWRTGQGQGLGTSVGALRGHTKPVYAIAWSPDSKHLVSAGYDGVLARWDTTTGRRLCTVKASQREIRCCAASPNGRVVATGGFDGLVKLWDAGTLRHIAVVSQLKGGNVAGLAIAPDSRGLACGGRYTERYHGRSVSPIFYHDLHKGRRVQTFRGHNNTVQCIAFSPRLPWVASAGGADNEVLVWHAFTGQVRHRLVGRGRSVFSCGLGHDGRSIYWGTDTTGSSTMATAPITHGFALDGFQLIPRAKVQSAAYRRVIHRAGGNTLQCTGRRYRPEVTVGGRRIHWPQTEDTITCLTLTPDARQAIVGSSKALLCFDASTGRPTGELIGHEGIVWAVSPSADGRRLLSASQDQTLKLWDVQSKQLIATFFFASDREWVVWTQSGYYASSARGGQYIGWHVNRGTDRAADFYQAERFRALYDRPDVVRETLRLGSEAAGLRVASEAARRQHAAVRAEELDRVRPPEITFVSPAEGSEVQSERVTVRFRVESVRRVTSVRASVNGRRIATGRGFGGVAAGSDDRSLSVPLEPGLNRITLFAAHDLATTEETLRVRRAEPKAATQAAPTELLPRIFIVAVGASHYEHLPADKQLRFPDDDARDIAQAFASMKGKLFREVRATVLAGQGTDGDPTRDAIEDALEAFTEAGQYDTCVLFVAGHGVTDSRGTYFFVPTDGRFRDNGEPRTSSMVRWSTIKDALDVPGRKIMLVDTCHAAASSGIKRRAVNSDELTKLLMDETTVVLTACRGSEESQEHPSWGHGAFTKCLLDGMRSKEADLIKDGVVSIKELDTYVSETVPKLTKGGQHPITFAPKGYESFVVYQ